MAAEQPPRPHTADPESRYSFFGTRRSFPLVGRKKSKAGSIISSSSSLERPSTSHHPVAAPTGLRVRLFLRFSAPLNSEHHAEFQSSPSFEPSDKVCQALLRRLQHCSAELITRRDCTAMDPPHAAPQSRPMRFQMTFCIDRHGLRWAEETFTSYQRDPVTAGLADDILAEARLSVSLFLSRHDPCFPCAEADAAAVRPETRRPSFGLAQSVCCVPHGTDNHLPGYLIELFLRSRGPGTQYNASLRLESQQSTPLTLLLGEDVLSRASRALDAAFGDRKAQFEEQHHACGGLEGTGGCEHITDGAFDALLKIRNNLGPDYNHLSHRLQSCRIVFKQNDSSDFDDFVNLLREQLGAVRDQADHGLNAVDDLSFNVRKLEIHDHSIPSPLCISLDASVTHGRRLTAALLDRVPTGISHKLEGTGASVVLTAHKRGHLVLDTVLGKAQDQAASMSNEPPPRIDDILTSLKYRIRDDIVMLCKDTCALESSDLLQNLRIYDARTAAYNERPSTSGPMLPDEPPVTPTRQSLSKRKGQFNLRQFSLSSSIGDSPCPATSSAQAREYTAVAPSDEAYLSDDSSTPSLVDTDSISPNDSILITPESSRVAHREPPTFGIRLMDDELMGAPISTQELGPHPDEEQTVYERPPFQNPFAPSKAPSALSVSICPDDVDADILPDTKSVPTQATPPCEKHDSPSTEEEEEVQDATATVKENQNSDNSATIIAVTGQVDPPQVESVEDVGTAHIPDVCEADISSSKDWPESAVAESPCTEDIMSSVTEVPSAPVEASLGELKEPQQPEIPISTANELETTQDDGEPIEEEVKIKEGEKPTVEEERTVQGPEKVDEEREKTTMATEDLFVQTETLIEETEKAAEERSMADEKVTGKGEERAGEEEMATQENKQQAGEEETASEKDEEQTGNEETAIEQHENPTELEKATIENKETVVESTTEYFSLGQSSARPAVQAASDRSKSSALILRQRPGSFHINSFLSEGLSDAASDEKQARRWSNPRPSIRHRRQFSSPTTGYLGLHGEYLVEMGLMNAVIPSHLRSSKP